MKYRAGDKITIVLTEKGAENLNDGCGVVLGQSAIVANEPAPKPIVVFVNVYENDMGTGNTSKSSADRYSASNRLACLKITYDPATKEAKAEVV